MEGFFAAGEVSASHGVYRPGGRALNAGQVGSTRAAQYIAAKRPGDPENDGFEKLLATAAAGIAEIADRAAADRGNVGEKWDEATVLMSQNGAAIRSATEIKNTLGAVDAELETFGNTVKAASNTELARTFRLYDMLLCQKVYLSAMLNYMEHGGKSRGSAMYCDKAGEKPYDSLPDTFTFALDDGSLDSYVQEVVYSNGKCSFNWREVRPIPEDNDFFENVWRTYRENGNTY